LCGGWIDDGAMLYQVRSPPKVVFGSIDLFYFVVLQIGSAVETTAWRYATVSEVDFRGYMVEMPGGVSVEIF
jgi:hypothetical protein